MKRGQIFIFGILKVVLKRRKRMIRKTLACCLIFLFAGPEDILRSANPSPDPMVYARGAADWILSVSRLEGNARTWPVDETDRKTPAFDLYSGMPGGIMLLSQLAVEDPSGPYAQTLPQAIAGLDSTKTSIGNVKTWAIPVGDRFALPIGLYTGVGGIAYMFLELHKATGNQDYLQRASEIYSSILAREKIFKGGGIWDNSNDIISGASGAGLSLLRGAQDLQSQPCLKMAQAAGDFLVQQAIPTPAGLKWKINPSADTVFPNFAHGTAGVTFFLFRLNQFAPEKKYLSAAMRGLSQLKATADVEEKQNSCIWYHNEGDGEFLYYAGWCHGPAGTGRLFYLAEKIGLENEKMWSQRAANWLIASGIPNPSKPLEGYWNEGICCGTAGIGEFMLDMYSATGNKAYLEMAEKMAARLARQAEKRGNGFCWVQAENREKPNPKIAQTGYSQGAAGIGLFFLKLARIQKGKPAGWKLPDSPF
jgi:lantibiotic modifying enzyme